MKHTLYLALRYMLFHKVKTVLLVISLALVLYLPLVLQLFANITEEQLLSRAVSTPLVLGSRGSSLDLVIDTLYFEQKDLRAIQWNDYEKLQNAEGMAIPVYTRFKAQQHLIVGTSPAYFEQRSLRMASGNPLRFLGECVLGSEVAQELGLRPGDSLLSEPENLFDIAGVYPLKMKVSGILAASHSPDDRAIFVDIKTAWVIEGLGHGHEDLAKVEDKDVILQQQGNQIAANAKLPTYTEITPENVDAFHFHGDRSEFPISAVLFFPDSRKSEDILRGRYAQDERLQMVKPETVIESLNSTLFRIHRIMNSGIALVALATALLVILVFTLSIRLRQEEISTLYKLGCAKGVVAGLILSELLIIGLSASGIALLLAFISSLEAERLIRFILF